jgi:hypothetical protein
MGTLQESKDTVYWKMEFVKPWIGINPISPFPK